MYAVEDQDGRETAPMFESQFIKSYPTILVASDEAGRGPLAGPVCASSVAIWLESERDLSVVLKNLKSWGVGDSKKISKTLRDEIYSKDLDSLKLELKTSFITEEQIDEINILKASLLAMKNSAIECVSKFKKAPVVWLVDGNRIPDNPFSWDVHPIVKGDSKSLLIGLASIHAKVSRDQKMQELHQLYPHYGFDQHAGYPTKSHRQSIQEFGPSPVHRKTFKGVREYL